MKKNQRYFDTFPELYDLMIPWEKRLSREIPFLAQLFNQYEVKTVLDLGCGTGHHARALSKSRYQVTGLDNSLAMIQYARKKSKEKNIQIKYIHGDFSLLIGKTKYDAVISLGNSLGILPEEKLLIKTFQGIRKVIKPDGMLLFQVLNYRKMIESNQFDYPVRTFQKDGSDYFLLRHFHIEKKKVQVYFTLLYQKDNQWTQETHITPTFLLTHSFLVNSLKKAGFNKIKIYGDMEFHPFHPKTSSDMIVLAQ